MLINSNFSNIDADCVKEAQGSTVTFAPSTVGLKAATEEFERGHIARVLEETNGNMTEASSRLGLERSHLYKKMKALGMEKGSG
jgi:DNA-binding NtrC family response regulator